MKRCSLFFFLIFTIVINSAHAAISVTATCYEPLGESYLSFDPVTLTNPSPSFLFNSKIHKTEFFELNLKPVQAPDIPGIEWKGVSLTRLDELTSVFIRAPKAEGKTSDVVIVERSEDNTNFCGTSNPLTLSYSINPHTRTAAEINIFCDLMVTR